MNLNYDRRKHLLFFELYDMVHDLLINEYFGFKIIKGYIILLKKTN